MDPAKLQGLEEWLTPKTVKDVRSFLGFGNFYRKFIKDYSKHAQPLHELLRKNETFAWTPARDQAFEKLKQKFTKEPVLAVIINQSGDLGK
jgi:hypothetical protein